MTHGESFWAAIDAQDRIHADGAYLARDKVRSVLLRYLGDQDGVTRAIARDLGIDLEGDKGD